MSIKKLGLLVFIFIVLLECRCSCGQFSFAVFGDNHDNYPVFQHLISEMNSDPDIQFAINDGDITQSGLASQYRKYWEIASTSNVKIYDVMGNHDLGSNNQGIKYFEKKYAKTYYYLDRDGCRFIMINNAMKSGLGADQWIWLKEALNTDKTLFVFMHKPLFDITGLFPKYVMAPLSENMKLQKLLADSGVKHIFASHIHGYARKKMNGVTYVITGGAGGHLFLPASNGGFYHYVKVTVSGKKVTDQLVRLYFLQ
jgi:Calcineurin-like phosphoesterase